MFKKTYAMCQWTKLTNLFLQNGFFPLDLVEALDECFPLLAFSLKAVDLESQLLQLSLANLQSLVCVESEESLCC